MSTTEPKCYIVSFEVSSEEVRQKVRERLKAYKRFCPINRYCWAIMTDQKASEVRDNVKEVMGSGDKLFVIRSGTEAAWRNAYGPKNSEWLKKNL